MTSIKRWEITIRAFFVAMFLTGCGIQTQGSAAFDASVLDGHSDSASIIDASVQDAVDSPMPEAGLGAGDALKDRETGDADAADVADATEDTGQGDGADTGSAPVDSALTDSSDASVLADATEDASKLFTVGGNISGVPGGSSVGLLLNGNMTLEGNGSFVLGMDLTSGQTYTVTIAAQPMGGTCIVSSGSGTIASANVTNIAVTCTATTYTLGGTVSGYTGSGLVLSDGTSVSVATGASAFTFPAPLMSGQSYSVTVKTQPATQSCTVTSNPSGTIAANVTNVVVTCVANSMFTLGGTLTGYTSSGLVLSTPTATNLPIPSGATTFMFSSFFMMAQMYSVTVQTQPMTPPQTCSVTSGATGTFAGSSVSNVVVGCTNSLRIQGASCSMNNQCVSNNCGMNNNTQCSFGGPGASCYTDGDCRSAECSTTTYKCLEGGYDATCYGNGDCLSGNCVGGNKCAESGATQGCYVNNDCFSSDCAAGVCQKGGSNTYCNGNSDCTSNKCTSHRCM